MHINLSTKTAWSGKISTSEIDLTIFVFLGPIKNDRADALLIVPSQNNARIGGALNIDENDLFITFPSIKAEFTSKAQATENQLIGAWEQFGKRVDLVLDVTTFEDANKILSDDQITQENEDHSEISSEPFEIITFDGVKLVGTISKPKDASLIRAGVVIVSGSGAQHRDGGKNVRNIYRDISTQLVNDGFATLRVDDRGIGDSGGIYSDCPVSSLAQDLECILKQFSKHESVSGVKIGVIGHSAGAFSASLATSTGLIDFLVLLAPPGISGASLLSWQYQQEINSMEIPEETKSLLMNFYKEFVRVIENSDAADSLNESIEKIEKEVKNAQQNNCNSELVTYLLENLLKLPEAMSKKFMTSFLKFNPIEAYSKIPTSIPLLVLFGDKDRQVSSELNNQPVTSATANNSNVQIKVLSLHNHLFQHTEGTGSILEYQSLPDGISKNCLSEIKQFFYSVCA